MREPRSSTRGVCPSCRRAGHVGSLCEHGACARHGIHFVPEADAPRPGSRDTLIGTMVARHLLVERIERRGVDTLYRALQMPAQLEVEVALATPERDASDHDDLFRQALALARLGSDANVTRLVVFGDEPAGTYLITDSAESSRTLGDLILPDGGEVAPASAARLLLEPLAAALRALARARLVHGAIRPEHIFVLDDPAARPIVRLGGFVRLPMPVASALSTWDLVWRPLEQIERQAVDATTDVYAVAAIAAALLMGRLPFVADDRDALMAAKRDPGFDPCDGYGAAFPAEVLHLLQTALAFDPAERFTADGFTHALAAALDALERAEGGVPDRVDGVDRSPAASFIREGRPPRLHDERALDQVLEAPAEVGDEAEPEPTEHAGTTQKLGARELEALVARRGTPRMHKRGS